MPDFKLPRIYESKWLDSATRLSQAYQDEFGGWWGRRVWRALRRRWAWRRRMRKATTHYAEPRITQNQMDDLNAAMEANAKRFPHHTGMFPRKGPHAAPPIQTYLKLYGVPPRSVRWNDMRGEWEEVPDGRPEGT